MADTTLSSSIFSEFISLVFKLLDLTFERLFGFSSGGGKIAFLALTYEWKEVTENIPIFASACFVDRDTWVSKS